MANAKRYERIEAWAQKRAVKAPNKKAALIRYRRIEQAAFDKYLIQD